MLSPALAPFAPKRKGGHCAGWRPPGALGRHGLRHGHLTRYPVVGVLGTGVPRLSCPRPVAWLKGGPARPIFINTNPRPSRGAKPRVADDTELPQTRPHQVGSRGGGEIKARYL